MTHTHTAFNSIKVDRMEHVVAWNAKVTEKKKKHVPFSSPR